jgi:hypothetical protein
VPCVSPEAAALARARGYLGPGSCAGGVQPVLKPVVAVAGDVVELGPHGVAVNGSPSSAGKSADVDAAGRALPHPARGRHLDPPDVVRLRSGAMVRGTILESDPGGETVLRAHDRQIRRYPSSEVEYAGPADRVPGPVAPPSSTPPSAPYAVPPPGVRPVPPTEPLIIPDPEPHAPPPSEGGARLRFTINVGERLRVTQVVGIQIRDLCIAPCDATVIGNPVRFMLSRGGRPAMELQPAVTVASGAIVHLAYHDRGPRRMAGVAVAAIGFAMCRAPSPAQQPDAAADVGREESGRAGQARRLDTGRATDCARRMRSGNGRDPLARDDQTRRI